VIGYLRRLIIRYLFSPYGIAIVPYCIFVFAWLFPPNTYTYYIHEPDLMYREPVVFWFFTACTAAFLLGVRIMGIFDTRSKVVELSKIKIRYVPPVIYLSVPLLLAAFPCMVFLKLLGSSVDVFGLLLSQQGDVFKRAISSSGIGNSSGGAWGSGLFLLTGVLFWSAYRSSQLDLKGLSRKVFLAVYFLCFAVDGLTCLATFDRTNLMPLLAGSTVIYLYIKTRGSDVKLGRLILVGVGSVVVIMGAFAALQLARTASNFDNFITSMLGYTIVSQNRLAALLRGSMHYVYQGKPAYTIVFFTQNDRFSAIREGMGLPDALSIWLSEFPSLSASGLNPSFNWAGVFGYVYSDLGWFTLLYMLFTGGFAGYLWSRFRAGKTFGLIFYPWMAFWILCWFGWNLLFDARGIVLMETTVLLFLYDKFLLRPARAAQRPVLVRGSSWEPLREQLPEPIHQPALTSRGGFV
jgi:hypothetical protein